jgi:hypothetical protein
MPLTCAAPGCVEPAARDRLMCAEHWRRVPQSVKYRIYRARHAYREEPTLERLREAVAARRAAREALERTRSSMPAGKLDRLAAWGKITRDWKA